MVINIGLPSLVLPEGVHISKDDCCMLGASNGNIEALFVLKETDFAVIICPNTAEDNNINFLALESIDSTHSNIRLLTECLQLFLNPSFNKLYLL